ncbi:helix-turn-helix domain-containing protein [Nonomuraea sp. KM88]|uniref:helix-turn-helix domain-containing protein n=1 Tax=Nonomuraea sp. KM88 TaxID=3457427 RepID=UPI003FCEDC76
MHALRLDACSIPLAGQEVVQVVVPLRGAVRAVWHDRGFAASCDDLVAHDLSRVHEVEFEAADGQDTFEMATVEIPRPLLPFSDRQLDDVLGVVQQASGGVPSLLKGFVRDLTLEKQSLRPADGARLGMVALDLISASFAAAIEERAEPSPESHRNVLTLRIQTFIQQNLRDPELTPRKIAAAHHISLSYLYQLFQAQGATVAGWLRVHRLRRIRRDLADPALTSRPIYEIASRWGFVRAADFSRAFRHAYGVTPSDFRKAMTDPD